MDMEERAKELWAIVDTVCAGYYIFKDEKVIEKAQKAAGQIQEYCIFFLQGNIFGMKEEEYRELCGYVMQVLEDFVEAVEQQDTVLMLDVLDYGLRELIELYAKKDEIEA